MNIQELKNKFEVLSISAKNDNTIYGGKIAFFGKMATTYYSQSFSNVLGEFNVYGTYDFNTIANFISKCNKDVTFSQEEGTLTLQSGSAKLSIPRQTDINGFEETIPNFTKFFDKSEYKDLTNYFNNKHVNFALQNVNFSNGYLFVSDGTVLLKRKLDIEFPKCFIHYDDIKNIIKLQPTEYTFNDGKLWFKAEYGYYSCPVQNTEYPALDSFFVKEEKNIAFTEEAKSVIDAATPFINSVGDIHFNINDGLMTLRNNNTEYSYSDSFKVDSELNNTQAAVNLKMLKLCVNDFGSATLTEKFFKFDNGNDFFVVALGS